MRYVYSLLFVFAVVAGLAAIKFKQISMLIRFGQAAQKSGPPPEVVGSATAEAASWETTLAAVGTITAQKGVTVASEVPGVITAIRFDSGALVKAGQVLVELDTSVERAQLASAEAREKLATTSAGRSRLLAEKDAIAKAQLDGDEAQLSTTRADLAALRAQIERKTIRAPFAGRLGIRQVNIGQYVNPGTPVATLESLGAVYVDFAVPQQRLADVSAGTPVRISLTGGGAYEGVVAAVDPTVDAVTRNIKLRARVTNAPKDVLRPGMFVNVVAQLKDKATVVATPATALVHASYGDSVFVIENRPDGQGKVARQQFVKVVAWRGDYVGLSAGLKAGQEVVTAGAFKLRNGASVVVNNDVKAPASLSPAVENR